ncbi:ABC transporter permease [Vagococcus vulneris]|uniref:ABC transporter permease n=1 Tax=Vagococcus vulneris TaxID=1977869 RepID=A0A430A1P3_9ENTE|nr:ABC transporter permease [Vagococcus vulneris]
MLSGIIFGIIFGFVLKRSRFCFTGLIRDFYLEKRASNLLIFLLIIFLGSIIYFILLHFKLITANEYGDFSILATVIGGLLFGIGAIFAHGCITIALIKTGDGRLTGLLTLLSFMFAASATKQGLLGNVSKDLQDSLVVSDKFVQTLPFSPVIISIIGLIIISTILVKKQPKHKNQITLPAQYTGLRHIFFEKIWSKTTAAILIGLISGFAWYASQLSGRPGSLGITTPLITWVNLIINHTTKLNWASYLVAGIILGSLICTVASREFSFKGTDGKTLIQGFLGGIFMGTGAVLGQGCLIGHGIIGTSVYSLQAWLGLLSIAIGIWIATYWFYKRKEV